MQQTTVSALIVAIVAGTAIGAQITLNSVAGRVAGPVNTGLLVNISGGLIATAIFLILLTSRTVSFEGSIRPALPAIVGAGLLGIGIITGVSFSAPRIGVAAGIVALLLGQMVIGLIVDTAGIGGIAPIPFTPSRIIGLALLAVATWLLLPRFN